MIICNRGCRLIVAYLSASCATATATLFLPLLFSSQGWSMLQSHWLEVVIACLLAPLTTAAAMLPGGEAACGFTPLLAVGHFAAVVFLSWFFYRRLRPNHGSAAGGHAPDCPENGSSP